jgi:lipopolysaccharide export system permease protein
VKILSRYILREHVGPFTFALTALTSLMILNFISRQFGELVGKGLPASVIAEFFLLSIPFTVALTLPMSVLMAVLYAFSRLAAENEITALKASGVSPWRLVTPALVSGVLMSLVLLAFNDQVLPRANYKLKTLQDDIAQTKPTFLLRPQVINAISEGKLYLKAGTIDRGSGQMHQVVIYDLGDPTRRRTIYADSGNISFAANRRDLEMVLYHGQMQEVATENPGQLDRLFYERDYILVRDVGNDLQRSEGDTTQRGDRELGICAMQKRLRIAKGQYDETMRDYREALRNAKLIKGDGPPVPKASVHVKAELPPDPHTLGWAYCQVLSRLIGVKAAQAADLRGVRLHPAAPAAQDTVPKRAHADSAARRDTTRRDTTRRRDTTLRRDSEARRDSAAVRPDSTGTTVILGTSKPPAPGSPGATPIQVPAQRQGPGAAPPKTFRDPFLARSAADSARAIQQQRAQEQGDVITNIARATEFKLRLDVAQRAMNRFQIEIHKKFALAAACIIFVVLGAPLALRFPRGGVGLVLLVSLIVFALYYVGLIGGEALANKGKLDPVWAMWGTNVVLTAVGIVLLLRMGKEENSGRGGTWGDRIDRWRDALRWRRRHALELRASEGETA